MSNRVTVHKGRTNTVTINMGRDISDSLITSQIRSGPDQNSPLIAEWNVDFQTDGVDGVLKLTLDDLITSQISAASGFMDLKEVIGGEPVPVFDEPLEVLFRGTVTV